MSGLRSRPSILHGLRLSFWGVLVLQLSVPLPAEEMRRNLDEPFDELVLTSEYDNVRIQVFPLPFSPDNMPRQSETPLRIRLIDFPDREYDVAWKDIARINFHEDLWIAEATQLVDAGRFEEAYDVLRSVWTQHPAWRGLDAAIDRFLKLDAGAAYRTRKNEQAIIVLDELLRRRPDAWVADALMRVVTREFSERLQAQDYRRARQLINWVSARPALQPQEKLATLRRQLRDLADAQINLARQASENQNYQEAFARLDAAKRVLPDDVTIKQLAAALRKSYPRVVVATGRGAPQPRTMIRDWAGDRADRLIDRHLVERIMQGADGGQYRSAYGEFQTDPDGLAAQLTLLDSPTGLALQESVRRTIAEAVVGQSATDPLLARLLTSWDVRQTGCHWRVADNTLRWLPLLDRRLATPLPDWQPFVRDNESEHTGTYLANPHRGPGGGQIVEILEREYPRQADMIAALESGDVDVIDRLLPAEAEQVSGDQFQVGRYDLISMYFLVPNDRSPLASNRVFRRGVVRSIPRQNMLNLILAGRSHDGCTVLSGPFHQGFERGDPLAYAWNPKLTPRPFDPLLGATLIAMSWQLAEPPRVQPLHAAGDSLPPPETREAASGRNTEQAAEALAAAESNASRGAADGAPSQTIVLVYADDAILASMAEQIRRSLRTAGISCEARRLPHGVSRPRDDDSWQLWLADVTAQEPIIDIFQMFGPGGLVTRPSPYVLQALDELAAATRWSDARNILNQIHELVYRELSLIPLWQLTNHYAYRSGLEGLGDNLMTLYQNVEAWNVNR